MNEIGKEEGLRWDIIGDLVLEDIYALWELLAKIDSEFSELAQGDRVAVANRIVGGMLEDGLIEVYLVEHGNPDTAMSDGERQALNTVRDVIQGGWRRAQSLPMWVAATEVGRKRIGEAPESVRARWKWPKEFKPTIADE